MGIIDWRNGLFVAILASLKLPGDRGSWQTVIVITELPGSVTLALVTLAMAQMTEDDIYRTSTQYRLWSFTRGALASVRSSTNASAADGVRAAIKSQLTEADSNTVREGGNDKPPDSPKEVDCLTVEEEQKLVGFYCVKAMQFADFCESPTNVKVAKAILLALHSITHLTKITRLQQCNTSSASISRTPL